jgi:hypothetical protein
MNMGTNWAHFSPSCFFIRTKQWLLKKNEKKLPQSFNFTFHFIDDVPSLNNYWFGDFVDRIYPIDIQLEIDNEGNFTRKEMISIF